jgi:hypothetical protein
MAAHIRHPRPGLRLPQDELLPIVITVTASTSQSCHLAAMDEEDPPIRALVPELWRIDEPHADHSSSPRAS